MTGDPDYQRTDMPPADDSSAPSRDAGDEPTRDEFWISDEPGSQRSLSRFGTELEPLQARLGDAADLYDVATWESRTIVDRIAFWIYHGIRGNAGHFMITAAVFLLLVQFAGAVFLLVGDPILGTFTIISVIPAFLLAGIIWYLDPTLRQPLRPLAAVFLLAIAFASFAALLNTIMLFGFRLIPVIGMALFFFLVVGPVEEFVKWLAIRVGGYRTIDSVIDGAVYGAVAGLGFATIENFVYIVQGYLVAAGPEALPTDQLRAAAATAAMRTFAGPGHVIYSAIAGFYLGLAKFNPDNWGPIVVKGLLIAAVVHASYNTIVTYAGFSGPVMLGFIVAFNAIFFIFIFLKIERYRRMYHQVVP